jgi:sugar (pentulose or hexulose) kinase
MADVLVGLDVGTTATKAQAFGLDGRVLGSASRGYGLITPQPDWVEQSPDELINAAAEATRQVVDRLSPHDHVVALALSSQGGTTIPVDAHGRPTYNAISWMDQRGDIQAARVGAALGAELIHTTTGWPLQNLLPLQHIAWLRDNCADRFATTRHFLFVNDFVGHWLTGELAMDPTNAGITQLFNVAAGDWDDRLLAAAGIERRQVSPILPCGRVICGVAAHASAATGLPAGTPVVNGAHDQYCAAVGAGVMQPGQVLLSCGTAWVLLAVPETLETGFAGRMAVGRHAVSGRWGAIRSLGGVGTSLEWLIDNVWDGRNATQPRDELYRRLNAEAAAASPGVNGLRFYPMAGGHAGNYGPARGGFTGLTLSHTRGDLARAVMEGIAFELRWVIEELRGAGVSVSELRLVGGAAASAVWPGIVADVSGIEVTLPDTREAAARGAAILAGVGIGLFADAEAGFAALAGRETRLQPQPEAVARYVEAFEVYQRGATLIGAE